MRGRQLEGGDLSPSVAGLKVYRPPPHRRAPATCPQNARRISRSARSLRDCTVAEMTEDQMSKTGRKRRSRKKKSANHGKRPNA
jgi:hypothetical protein